ncbi:MAG: preprotein translocase subunit YajC [Phycisphaerae bacterium]
MIEQLYMLGQNQQGQPGGSILLIGMVIFVGVFFFMNSRSQKREKDKKKAMLNSLSKNDRVMTIGGVIGTVVVVKENEVTVKVDEATNTRMTFIKRSIQQVITSDEDLKRASV